MHFTTPCKQKTILRSATFPKTPSKNAHKTQKAPAKAGATLYKNFLN